MVMCHRNVFGPGPLEDQLQNALVLHLDWCKDRGFQSSLEELGTNSLGLTSAKAFPFVHCKGGDMKILLLWLGKTAAAWAAAQGDYEKLCATCGWALARFIAVLDEADLFVTEEQAAELVEATPWCPKRV